ncbi:MAG: DNA-directed RNA polymerase subunit L [archaeon]|nr:DNA-directed RNA polymerase subunit L [archaeon]
MKVTVLKNEKESAEFLVEGERHSFPGLLKQKLLDNKDVEFVSYVLDHPLDRSARFVVKTKGKSPKKALEDACKEIESELSDFDKSVKKALK